jgi:hypothetical protein
MSYFAVVLMGLVACNRDALDTEELCDGLDNDRDGLIDEGLFGYDIVQPSDEAGVLAAEDEIGTILRVPNGMLSRSYEGETSEGETLSAWVELDGMGHAIAMEQISTNSEGLQTVNIQSAAYEGDLKVWDAGTRTVDGETVLDYEQSWTYHDHGQASTHSYAEAVSGRTLATEWFYDEQEREILWRREGSQISCGEWVTAYDDTLNTKTAYAGVSCGDDPPATHWVRSTYDSQGRLLSIEEEQDAVTRAWTWEGDDPATYTSALGDTRSFEVQDGVVVGATGEGELSDWMLGYHDSGRIDELGYETPEGVAYALALEYSDLAGGFLSGVTTFSDGEQAFRSSYALDEVGNFFAVSWEYLASGVTGEIQHSTECQEGA